MWLLWVRKVEIGVVLHPGAGSGVLPALELEIEEVLEPFSEGELANECTHGLHEHDEAILVFV